MLNTIIGKYKVLRLIGEGGMATVYEAEHEILATRVAIKVLNPILSANSQIRERFMNEAKIMASLNHPNIIKVIDFDDQPQQLSIVLELLEGEDLDEKMKKNGPLNDEELNNIFSQTLSAFEYAHSKGIVHRDIKPANIYLLPNGTVKILDFGIAKLFGQGNEMTQTGTQMGTPIYMSPEQIRGEKSIDHRSDIYSLGVTLFVAVSGKTPYDSKTESQFDIFNKIVHEPLPEISGNGKFNTLINKACCKDRELRFQSCEEWLGEMNNSVINSPETAKESKVENATIEINADLSNQSTVQEIKAAESPKSFQKEEEIETIAVLDNIPTKFFNLNRLLIGVILGTLVGAFLSLVLMGMGMGLFHIALLLCIISSSLLFFKPSKIILRITITVFALFWSLYFFRIYWDFGAPIIIVIALFCSLKSFNKTAFVLYMLAFIVFNLYLLTNIIQGYYLEDLLSLVGCFLVLYLCSIIVFFFYNKYFGKFIFTAICCVNLLILYSILGGFRLFDYEQTYSLDISKNLLLLLLLPIIELSSRLQPKAPTRQL
jgi:serine/threonine protein kinase